jgi:hypothetical protein
MLVGQRPRLSTLDLFKPYLLRRISDGCRKVAVLHREVAAQGSPVVTASSVLLSNSTASARRTLVGSEPFLTVARDGPPRLSWCAHLPTCLISGLGLDLLHRRRVRASVRRTLDYHLNRILMERP